MITITSEPFGTTRAGEAVTRYTMTNSDGMSVQVLSYACAIQRILVPDLDRNPQDVVLGYDTLEGYESGNCFLGAFVGRYANRIKGAEFALNGKTYTLPKNDGNNHLHGVFCNQVFHGEIEGDSLVFTKVSPDGEEGYPGNLSLRIIYTLDDENGLTLDYYAETDADTVLNLTNHSYFNLNGQDGSDILDHELTLSADRFTEGDAETLPTGRILPAEGTPFDFRSPKTIGSDLDLSCEQLRLASGYDHNLILTGEVGELRPFAHVVSPKTGIAMTGFTTQPAMQLYTGNFLTGDTAPCGKNGMKFIKHGAFCLETQHYPCSPNFPEFPSTVLRPGEQYHETTVYRFGVE